MGIKEIPLSQIHELLKDKTIKVIPQIDAMLKGKTFKVIYSWWDEDGGHEKKYEAVVEKVTTEKTSWGEDTPVVVGTNGEKNYPTIESLINVIAYGGEYTDIPYDSGVQWKYSVED